MIFKQIKYNIVTRVHCAVFLIFIFLVFVYRASVETPKMEKKPKITYLLQWTSPYTEPISFMGKGMETFIKRKCPITNCFVTSDRKMLEDITDFDVVIFHTREIVGQDAVLMPEKRSRDQIYVFASMESSGYYPVLSDLYNNYFNITWTYKLDSDINFGYFAIMNKNGERIGPSENIRWIAHNEMQPINETMKKKLASKKTAAAWFVSNCRTPGRRETLVKDIQKEMKIYGLSLDVYGRCGDKKCPRSSMLNCLKLLESDYYFYFAFENTFAEDYVTEKLLHALQNYAVPVVYGGANYTRFMPNGTYLDATFLEPKELVQKMFQLIIDPEKYHEYFKWRNHYSYHEIQTSPDTDPFCKLCEYVNNMKDENRTSVVTELDDWWNPRPEQWNKPYDVKHSFKKVKKVNLKKYKVRKHP